MNNCPANRLIDIESVGLRLRCDLRPHYAGKHRMKLTEDVLIFFWLEGESEVRNKKAEVS